MTAWIPDVVADEVIASAWGNSIRDRAVHPFANVAARTAAIPSPIAGQMAWMIDTKTLVQYDGSTWEPVVAKPRFVPFAGEPITSTTGDQIGLDSDLGTPGYNYRLVILVTWEYFHTTAGGATITLRWTDTGGTALAGTSDAVCTPSAANVSYYAARQFFVNKSAGQQGSFRVSAFVSGGSGGVRLGQARILQERT